jgi:hypothetical protein
MKPNEAAQDMAAHKHYNTHKSGGSFQQFIDDHLSLLLSLIIEFRRIHLA